MAGDLFADRSFEELTRSSHLPNMPPRKQRGSDTSPEPEPEPDVESNASDETETCTIELDGGSSDNESEPSEQHSRQNTPSPSRRATSTSKSHKTLSREDFLKINELDDPIDLGLYDENFTKVDRTVLWTVEELARLPQENHFLCRSFRIGLSDWEIPPSHEIRPLKQRAQLPDPPQKQTKRQRTRR